MQIECKTDLPNHYKNPSPVSKELKLDSTKTVDREVYKLDAVYETQCKNRLWVTRRPHLQLHFLVLGLH